MHIGIHIKCCTYSIMRLDSPYTGYPQHLKYWLVLTNNMYHLNLWTLHVLQVLIEIPYKQYFICETWPYCRNSKIEQKQSNFLHLKW